MYEGLYVKGSLKKQGEGLVFQLRNSIDSGSVSRVANMVVDGKEKSLEGATVELGDRVHPVSEISSSSPMYVSYGATLTLYVPGPLESGEHTITAQFDTLEAGPIRVLIADTVV